MKNVVRLKDNPGWICHSVDDVFEATSETLAPGVYALDFYGGPFVKVPMFTPVQNPETLVRFKSGTVAEVLDLTKWFFSEDTSLKFSEMGMRHKMGILMYGPPGTGKTCTATMIMQDISNMYNAVCLDCTGIKIEGILKAVTKLRSFQDSPVVIFCDEFEDLCRVDESELLTFLDGSASLDRVMFIGCTNFISRIPSRIKDRPSRIKRCIHIKGTPEEVVSEFIRSKAPRIPSEIAHEICHWASEKSLTIDQLKHVLIDVYINRSPVQDAVEMACKISEDE